MTTKPPPDDDTDVIERLDAGEPPSSPEDADARAPYERLFARIRDLEDTAPPAGWEDRAIGRWSATRTRRRVGMAFGLAAAVGLAAALLVPLCRVRTEPALQIAVSKAPGATQRGEYAVGDTLRARARVDRAHVELRIYIVTRLSARLIVRCPGTTPCRSDTSALEVAWKLAEPGTYRITMLSGASELPPPGDGTIDRDLLEARNAGASTITETVTVGP